MKNIAVMSLFTVALSTLVNTAQADEYQDLLLNAQQYYEANNYQDALATYQASYQLSPLDSTLYNIAICHYKLQQWQAALTAFKQLKMNQAGSDLIEYNIAVTHKKLGQVETANRIFFTLAQTGENEDIAILAEQQLNRTADKLTSQNPETKESHQSQWQHVLNLQAGNESNIVLPDGENFTEKSDQFVDYLFSSSWLSDTNLDNAWLADFTYFGSQYAEASNYEVSMYALSMRKFITFNTLPKVRFHIGSAYESIDLSGNNYLDSFSVKFGARYSISNSQKLLFSYQYKDISEGADYFDYLAGDSTRLKVAWKQNATAGYWKLGAKWQLDDRADRYLEDEFISYSADRYSLFASRYWQINQWELDLFAEYRLSEYHDQNIYQGEFDTLREDDKLQLSANLTYNISDNFSVHGAFDYTDNSSTLSENEYDQTTASVGITLHF